MTPNTLLTPFQTIQSTSPASVGPQNEAAAPAIAAAAATEHTNWAITDAKTDTLWGMLAPNQDFLVGIIDTGFDDHEDIVMEKGLVQTLNSADHGNHVAEIACGSHNGVGIKGAAPRCTARVAVGTFLFPAINPIESEGPLGFHTLFSELVATVLDYLSQNPDVNVINLSLGYNWMPNFGINPESDDAAGVRDLVRGQGRIMLSILEFARQRDVVIVSAAGNDSTNLSANPLASKWASPFNWAALAMEETLGWSNGFVVEAHGEDRERAKFSNDEGMVSAGGVDIFSALAGSIDNYGTLSGTSMASPLVAGSIAMLRALNPAVNLEGLYQCIVPNTGNSNKVNFEDIATCLASA